MVLVSYSGKEINAKIVFYGPGLCGKTTNLEYIYGSIPSKNRGKMVSMKTKTERTLFFDFLPLNLGELAGFKTRFLLYTVPGQVYYNATRKLVLKGVDAVIFVADSQRGKMDENIESLQNLKDNLKEHGLSIGEVPYVVQYNKRDLPDVYPLDELERDLNSEGVPSFEGIATTGEGVFETFKAVSKLLLAKLSKEIGATVVDERGGSAAAAARAAAKGVSSTPEARPSDPTPPREEPVAAEFVQEELAPEPAPREPASASPPEADAHQLGIIGPEPEATEPVSPEEPQKSRGLWKWLRKDGAGEEAGPELAAEADRPTPAPDPEPVKDLGVTRGHGVFSETVGAQKPFEVAATPPPEEHAAPAAVASDFGVTHDVSPAAAHEPAPVDEEVFAAREEEPVAEQVPQTQPLTDSVEAHDGAIIVPIIVPRSAVRDKLEIRLVLHLAQAQEPEADDEFEADARARGII